MENDVSLILGGKHVDHRGTLIFVNDFDMSKVKRMYAIHHEDTLVKRGWRGHKLEQRWFFVCKGEFEVKVVRISDWENPDPNLGIETYILSINEPMILHVPTGYATSFRAVLPNSTCMVYADADIKEAKADDHLYDVNYFNNDNDQ